MKKVFALIKRDLKNSLRDYVLLMAVIAPLLLTGFLHLTLPFITDLLLEKLEFDLTVYYPLIFVYVILFTPMIVGTFMGFIILDEKDDDILTYIAVTELGKPGFLTYRIISPLIVSLIMSIIVTKILPLADVEPLRLAIMIIVASISAPLTAFFLGGFAKNKVEGLAYSKGLGILFITPAISYIFTNSWKYVLSFSPPFWVSEILIAPNPTGIILIAIAINVVYLLLLVRKFK